MKKLLLVTLGMALSTPLMAWNNPVEDMNTMNNNMSGPVVRTVKKYPGMFRGWTDNAGFRRGSYVSTYVAPKKHYSPVKKKRYKNFSKSVKKYRHNHPHAHQKSGVCIAKCFCDGHH